jgi:hypothetical protein
MLEYKPPSLLAEHKYLAIVFLLAIIAASLYLLRAPPEPRKLSLPPSPVYVEPINPRTD